MTRATGIANTFQLGIWQIWNFHWTLFRSSIRLVFGSADNLKPQNLMAFAKNGAIQEYCQKLFAQNEINPAVLLKVQIYYCRHLAIEFYLRQSSQIFRLG